MDLIHFYQYFHAVREMPDVLISISLDILKFTQLEISSGIAPEIVFNLGAQSYCGRGYKNRDPS